MVKNLWKFFFKVSFRYFRNHILLLCIAAETYQAISNLQRGRVNGTNGYYDVPLKDTDLLEHVKDAARKVNNIVKQNLEIFNILQLMITSNFANEITFTHFFNEM